MAPIAESTESSPLHVPSDPTAELKVKRSGFASTQASVLLDAVRGIAALLVMFDHWRNLFFVDYGEIAAHRIWYAVPYVLSSGGHQAVIIFFVLSGYLISGSVFRMFRKDAWSWGSYLLARLVRLWIVLVPGLLFAALCDYIGLHLHRAGAVTLYTGLSGNHMIDDIRPVFHFSLWIANLFFLQHLYVPVFGSDGALWSLANEFWYYVLFPIGLLGLRRGAPVPMRCLYIVLFVALLYLSPSSLTFMFGAWLMGTVLFLLPPPRLSGFWRAAATVLYLPIFFFFAKTPTKYSVAQDLFLSVLTAGLFYVLLSARGPSHESHLATRIWRLLARFSYSLYIVHLPLLVLLGGLTLGVQRWQPDVLHVAIALSLAAIAVAYAYGIASATEFRTDQLRRAIERRLP